MEYIRPELTIEDQNNILRWVRRLLNLRKAEYTQLISLVLTENILLTREVNAHRAARGYDELPTYNPKL